MGDVAAGTAFKVGDARRAGDAVGDADVTTAFCWAASSTEGVRVADVETGVDVDLGFAVTVGRFVPSAPGMTST